MRAGQGMSDVWLAIFTFCRHDQQNVPATFVMTALEPGPYAESGVWLADLWLHYSCYEYSLIYTH